MDVKLFRATEADIPFVMTIERAEGYEELAGQWDEPRHRAALTDHRHAYFIALAEMKPIGFAILEDWASPENATFLRRIAIHPPGQGYGKAFLRTLIAAVFKETDAHRLWLGVFPENIRARRAYEAVGFVAEGTARGSAFFKGAYRDELIMAILRTDWSATRVA